MTDREVIEAYAELIREMLSAWGIITDPIECEAYRQRAAARFLQINESRTEQALKLHEKEAGEDGS